MSEQKVKFQITVSADGYMAGPDQGPENPLGAGGMALHDWMFSVEDVESTPSGVLVEYGVRAAGATIMGRNMFGGGPGPWDEDWTGWWGDDPPFHHPVFVLTKHPRESVEMDGGTTYHFVTDGIESALKQARAAAGEKDVIIGGGAQTAQQFLVAGLVDEFFLTIAPLILGDGERLLDGIDPAQLRVAQEEVFEGNGVTHVRYRVLPRPS
ncbi:MAG: dihydrofolate reductase family protein [Solirubrobacterales bacterium]